ncbi:uncharacterized protein LOC122640625 [Telopea speciosissima]|uniref:uncharacterized protein LOC122640625 n=1 Tax=Telopea speciosissima TaxID=54955 RepID=UPI001CC37345|nr:uncharacterized protein LOC122640625 [Telopea speciosissima]
MCETRNFYLWLIQVVLLTVILFLLLWFLLPPRSPKYTINDFYVPAFNEAMNTTTTTKEISIRNTTIIFHLEIENPNEDNTISSDAIKVTLFYGNDSLGETIFNQIVSLNKGSIIENGIVNGDRQLLQKAVSGVVRNRMTTKTKTAAATADLRMDLVTGVKYKMWFWKSKHHGVNMEGKVPVGKDGKISAKNKKLRLHRSPKKHK